MARIGFLGLGNMGLGMAGRLIAAGHDVHVWNRTAAKAQALSGATAAATPREAADGADAIFAMVADDAASEAVWCGPDGALAGASAGTIAADCSTLSHAWVTQLAQRAAAAGLRYVDSPVTGLPDAAAEGRLTLLVGAADGDLAAARPLLEPMAADIVHFGPVGAGTAYKLMINLMGAVQIAAAAEGLLIAEAAGLDMHKVMYALERGQAASPQVVRNARRMVDDQHTEDILFTGRLRLKDVRCGLALADSLNQTAGFGRVAEAALERLLDLGLGERNESQIIAALRGDGSG